MFRKHVIALALLALAGTSGASFAAGHPNDPAAAKQRHPVTTTSDEYAAQIQRFFNGNPPEGWPHLPN